MFVDRQSLVPEIEMSVAALRKHCMGCSDCKGACLELLQMHALPDVLSTLSRERQETAS